MITYLVVGVLLVAAAIGAVVVLQNRSGSDLTTRPDTTEVAQRDDEREVPREREDESESTGADAEAPRSDEPSESPATETPSAGPAASTTPDQPAMPSGGAASEGQGALPSTGPAQTLLGNVIGLLAIIGAGYGYYHFGQRR